MVNRIIRFYQNNKKIYKELIINDFKTRYSGSFLGMIWGFIQPIVTIMIYWLVFQYGLKSGERPDGIPYVIYMVSGAIPWFFFSDVWGGITSCFIDYSYLVKKLNFNINLIPLVKIGSGLIVHLTFLAVSILVLNVAGYRVQWNYLQLIYYLFALIVFSYAMGMLTSSVAVYIRDIIQVVGIFIQIGFWANPICWGDEIATGVFGKILKLNPMYYIVIGYRNALLYNERLVLDRPSMSLYFWIVVLFMLALGRYMYKKLRPNFADVM